MINSSNMNIVFYNKPFKAFIQCQMFDKPTSLLAIKMWNCYTTLI